ncbi:MAG: hypothetical protein ABIG11_05575, partial [bacterium]
MSLAGIAFAWTSGRAALSLQTSGGQAELNADERAFMDSCGDNLKPGSALDPDKADDCLRGLNADNSALLNKLGVDDSAGLLKKANALVDLRDFLNQSDEGKIISDGLETRGSRLKIRRNNDGVWRDDTVAGALEIVGLGPEPDKLIPWTKKYAPHKLKLAESAVMCRDSLSIGQRRYLSSVRLAEQWHITTLPDRKAALALWAEDKCAEIIQTDPASPAINRKHVHNGLETLRSAAPYFDSRMSNKVIDYLIKIPPHKFDRAAVREIVGIIWTSLNGEQKNKWLNCGRNFDNLEEAVRELKRQIKTAKSEEKNKYIEAQKKIDKIKELSAEEQLVYLGGVFDLSRITGDASAGMTSEQKEQFVIKDAHLEQASLVLITALKNEIKGTIAGDKVLNFYADRTLKGNELKLRIASAPGILG